MIKHILSVGCELEGGFPRTGEMTRLLTSTRHREKLHICIGNDGSVSVDSPAEPAIVGWHRSSEIRAWCPVGQLHGGGGLYNFARLLWKEGFKQNSTCGNHLHFKLSEKGLFAVGLDGFFRRWLQGYRRRAPFSAPKFRRRESGNYCAVPSEWSPESGFRSIGSRYTAINLHSFHRHGTVEVRILPYADDASEWCSMVGAMVRLLDESIDGALKEVEGKPVWLQRSSLCFREAGKWCSSFSAFFPDGKASPEVLTVEIPTEKTRGISCAC